jgi:hypothetical protein
MNNREMILLPVLGLAAMLLITIVVGVSIYYPLQGLSPQGGGMNNIDQPQNIWVLIPVVLYCFSLHFMGVFFSAALVYCVHRRLKGEEVSVYDGIKNSLENIQAIFMWAIFATTVGMIISAMKKNLRGSSTLVGLFGSITWDMAVFFIVPVLIIEKQGVIASLKRSAGLFAERWGEVVAGGAGMALVSTICVLGGWFLIGLNCYLFHIPWAIGVGMAILYLLVIIVLSMLLNDVYLTGLYYYAVTGKTGPFSEDLLRDAGVPRREGPRPN